MSDPLGRALDEIETLRRLLEREGQRREIAEATLRRRGGDAVIAEAESAYFRAQVVHGAAREKSRLQSKCEAQRKEIVRLTRLLYEQGGQP